MILAGDVGGTKVSVGIFGPGDGRRPQVLRQAVYAGDDYRGLADILLDFLGDGAEEVALACFGVAGPVIDNAADLPNIRWGHVDGGRVAAAVGLSEVLLINDLVATAEGIPALAGDELQVLQEGEELGGTAVLIAAGTGLGMALLPESGRGRPLPSEGGHAGFAPRTLEDTDLVRHLIRRFGHQPAIEMIVSGPGLVHAYEYLRDSGVAPEREEVRRQMAAGDPAEAISEAALADACPLCARALALFVGAYGSVAGDLALIGLATAGLYVGGGIAPKILPRLADGSFLAAFLDKGDYRPFMERIPVRVILNPEAGLLGAARRGFSAL
jgi:glucokinase